LKALILAGGLGTRLRPLTFTRPKHLLPIVNRPHLAHVFDLLLRAGVTEVVLLTSYLAESFAEPIADARSMGIDVMVAREEEPLGTAGALKNGESFVQDGTFFVFNGDILTDVDLSWLAKWHRDRDAHATIMLTPVDDPSSFGVVPTEEDGRVLGFIEKPPAGEAPTNLINAGVYVLEPSVLDRIPAGEVYSAERQMFPGLVADEARLFAVATDGYWMDIGTPKKYLQANMDALAGVFSAGIRDRSGDSVVAEDAGVAPGAVVASSCLGPKTLIEEGAVVEGSVLLPNAVVGKDARVVSSILGEGARVRPGGMVGGRTIGDGEEVG
jgi:mannose-1-phosphate guanylyltransferase